MKCPNCGHWNRASFPRCFRCGTPLTPEDAAQERPGIPEQSAKVYIQINEEGKATPTMDERDKLAIEMKNLLARKQKGELEQQRLRESGAQQGLAPTGRSVQTLTGHSPFPLPQNTSYSSDGPEVEGNVRPDAIPVVSQRTIGYDDAPDFRDTYSTGSARQPRAVKTRRFKTGRHYGFHRFLRVLLILVLLGGAGFAGYRWGVKPLILDKMTPPLQEQVIISQSILNDMPAHIIRLPGEEGQNIWIKELKKSYPVVGGYATIEVADYTWYENSESVTQETVTATLTPYLKTNAGEQKKMDQVSFEVEIPLSPLTLVSPSSTYVEVSTALYNIQFEVAENSAVTINGEDFSDLVSTQNGLISYNVSVSPIGENPITIVTRSQYYRENSMTIILYREPQQIRLDLAADIATRYSPNLVEDKTQEPNAKGEYPLIEPNMTVRGTTVSWATITVRSPYKNLDTTQLALNGSFSFEAVFDKIGDNTIIIEASAPGYKTSVVKHNVYYVPIAAIYTRKAWDMNTQYTDYLNNSERRIANTQIYVCSGVITEIRSTKPQMAIMKLNSTQDRTVLLRNYSNDTWTVGTEYRIFADAYGIYDGAPWLNGRYTYPPLTK